MSDSRVVCGATCSWWDTIDKVSKLPSGIPCCPTCSGVLFEYPNLDKWWKDATRYSKENNDPSYLNFLKWMRGKCFKDWTVARETFDEIHNTTH